jgi:hypothetical protein
MLGLLELIVAKRLCKTIYLTRLPVGHTHEDIDGVFSRIWTKLRKLAVITPQAYAALIKDSIKGKEGRQKILDLYCIPDYKSLFEDCLDPNIGRFSKEQWTQLMFRFDSVPISDHFPNGVEVLDIILFFIFCYLFCVFD